MDNIDDVRQQEKIESVKKVKHIKHESQNYPVTSLKLEPLHKKAAEKKSIDVKLDLTDESSDPNRLKSISLSGNRMNMSRHQDLDHKHSKSNNNSDNLDENSLIIERINKNKYMTSIDKDRIEQETKRSNKKRDLHEIVLQSINQEGNKL